MIPTFNGMSEITPHDAEILAAVRSLPVQSRDFVVAPGGLTSTTVPSSKSFLVILAAIAVAVGGFAGFTMLKSKPATATRSTTQYTTKRATQEQPATTQQKGAATRGRVPAPGTTAAFNLGRIVGGALGTVLLAALVVLVIRRRRKPAAVAAIETPQSPSCANGHEMDATNKFCSTCGAEAAA